MAASLVFDQGFLSPERSDCSLRFKRGKNFQNPGSSLWSLEPADSFETESTIKRLGERAKMYLERVVKEHPGTPWARIAEEELRSPMGWTWRES